MVRVFTLINADGEETSLNDLSTFGYQPDGLGISFDNSFYGANANFIEQDSNINQAQFTINILFSNGIVESYAKYREFVQFLNKTPLTLKYSIDGQGSFLRDCKVRELTKTEVGEWNTIDQTLTLDFTTPWYRWVEGSYNEITDQMQDGKIYAKNTTTTKKSTLFRSPRNNINTIVCDSLGNVYCGADGVYKYSPDGTLLWHFTSTDATQVNCLAITSDFYVYAGCESSAIIRLDPSGNQVGKTNFDGLQDWSNVAVDYITCDSDGNVYVAGNRAVYYSKYNSSFTMMWRKTLSPSYTATGVEISVEQDGFLYLIKDFPAFRDLYKFYTNGDLGKNLRYQKSEKIMKAVKVDSNGYVYLLVTDANTNKTCLEKLNSNFQRLNSVVLNSGTVDTSIVETMDIDENDNIYVCANDGFVYKVNSSNLQIQETFQIYLHSTDKGAIVPCIECFQDKIYAAHIFDNRAMRVETVDNTAFFYNYDYIYEEARAWNGVFRIRNDSVYMGSSLASPIEITIYGGDNGIRNPEWELLDGLNVIQNDRYFLEIPAEYKLVVSSIPQNQYARLIAPDGTSRNVYQYQDMTKTNFVKIPVGKYILHFPQNGVKASFRMKCEWVVV